MPTILVPERLRLEDCCKFKASLDCIASTSQPGLCSERQVFLPSVGFSSVSWLVTHC